jgi:uncharacterized protein
MIASAGLARRFDVRVLAGLLAVVSIAGCGPGSAAEAIRPKDPTASDVLGEGECRGVAEGAEPLVVDWKPEQRGDLEVAMKDGLAVFAYSCTSIKLLPDCHIDGSYGFIGMTKKEQVVRLENADEVRANLPLTGAKLGGEMQRGSSLNVAMVMVGKKRTTWNDPTRVDLKGSCDGATHYVRSATVGAFVLAMGTQAKVAAAAELFGASTSASSSSNKDSRNQEGDPSDCAKSAPDAEKPPPQCGAPIRLVLSPIAAAPDPAKVGEAPKPAPKASDEPTCPQGLVLAEGKCTKPTSAAAYQCKAGDEAECTAQCDKGHAGSCSTLGEMLVRSDAGKASGYFKKGCDGDVAEACVGLARLTQDAAQANQLYEKGCKGGAAAGCGGLGRAYLTGTGGVGADPARAVALFSQGCEGGHDESCAQAGQLYAEGKGVAKDPTKAVELHKRACDGSVSQSCLDLGRLYETGGQGLGKNPILAEMLYRRACFRNSPEGCVELGRYEYLRNPDMAKRHFQNGCMRNVKLGCAIMIVGYGDKRPFMPDIAQKNQLMTSCNGGNMRDCVLSGLMDAASNMPTGKMSLGRACNMGDKFACEMAKKLK